MTKPPFNHSRVWSFVFIAALHGAVPLVSALGFGAPAIWIFSNLLFALFLVLLATTWHSTAHRITSSVLSGGWMLTSIALGAAYYMQGSGFNDAFFYHLDVNTLGVAGSSYTIPTVSAVLLLLLAVVWPWIFRPSPIEARAPMLAGTAAALLVSVLSASPAHSWLEYRQSTLFASPERTDLAAEGTDSAAVVVPEPPAPDTPGAVSNEAEPVPPQGAPVPLTATDSAAGPSSDEAPAAPKNILLIYAEGIEQTYLDQETFGDLLPNIRELAAQGSQFVDMYQLPGTSWTVAGLVASQCGFPVVVGHHSASNSTLATVREPFPDSLCLADVLRREGYRTVYMGGADNDFAGKGSFLRSHGYEEVLGLRELTDQVPDPAYLKDWGLYDDTLFDLAVGKLRDLQSGDAPWLLTVLTVDTHHPHGKPSKSCEPFPGNDDPMSDAIYCSDQLIGRFVRKALSIVDPRETVIVLFSDHLSLRNSLWRQLRRMQDERRLLFVLLDDGPAETLSTSGSHFDVAPTILDVAGVRLESSLGHGVSLFDPAIRGRAGKPTIDDYWEVPRVLASSHTALEAGVRVSAADWSLQIGDLQLSPNRHGFEFEYGMFMAVLNEDGKVQDTLYYNDYPTLLKNYEDRFVVGVSMTEGDPGPLVFAGRVSSDPSKIVQRPLIEDIRFSPTTLAQLMQR